MYFNDNNKNYISQNIIQQIIFGHN